MSGDGLPPLREVIAEHGLPCALYTDRGSHDFHTPEAEAGRIRDGIESSFNSSASVDCLLEPSDEVALAADTLENLH